MESNHMMVVLVAIIVMVGLVLRARYVAIASTDRIPDQQGAVSKEELDRIRERLAVLERLAIEKDNSLALEFERLKNE